MKHQKSKKTPVLRYEEVPEDESKTELLLDEQPDQNINITETSMSKYNYKPLLDKKPYQTGNIIEESMSEYDSGPGQKKNIIEPNMSDYIGERSQTSSRDILNIDSNSVKDMRYSNDGEDIRFDYNPSMRAKTGNGYASEYDSVKEGNIKDGSDFLNRQGTDAGKILMNNNGQQSGRGDMSDNYDEYQQQNNFGDEDINSRQLEYIDDSLNYEAFSVREQPMSTNNTSREDNIGDIARGTEDKSKIPKAATFAIKHFTVGQLGIGGGLVGNHSNTHAVKSDKASELVAPAKVKYNDLDLKNNNNSSVMEDKRFHSNLENKKILKGLFSS